MDNKPLKDVALDLSKEIRKELGNLVDEFCIDEIFDEPGHKSFQIKFTIYNYFPIIMSYDNGRFGCSIDYGKRNIVLSNSQEWLDTADMHLFFSTFRSDIEYRIPDKYLANWKSCNNIDKINN
jgi:hypothetical protein